ncbi:MAG: ParB/RepB/Spo0J family partition protein [Acetobacteraceae bacterium]|nr:ParB/RepB/Spo0J family partition protein [Acetobacteraceae bacterium]
MSGASPRLGRGLAALLGETASPVQPRTSLAVTALEPGPFQPRTAVDPERLADLTESIKAQGVLQPLLARPHPEKPGHYQIIAGERRWRASQAAGLHEVPVLIRQLSDTEAMAASLVENLQRQDLDPIEEAEGYKRLIGEFGLTQDGLGDLVGKSRSHVANTMRLLHLPSSVRDGLRAGTLSAGHARALLTHPDPAAAAKIVIARGLNVRQTEALVQRGAASPPQAKAADPEVAALERELSARLGLKVQLTQEGRGGSIKIAYRNLDQLDAVLELLRRD